MIRSSRPSRLACAWLAVILAAGPAAAQNKDEYENIAGPYVPTPWVIVDDMLKLADVRADDVLYDLGSGDGRLVITAARRYGARGVGVELQTALVEMAQIQAKHDGVESRVKFVQGDLFQTDLREATIVTLYLLPRFVERLVPKLRAELRPGSRIVSHDYPLLPWPPDKVLYFDVAEKEAISGSTRTNLYYYVVPARVRGVWELSLPRALAPAPLSLEIRQEPDALDGIARASGDSFVLRGLALQGDRIRFELLYRGKPMSLAGTVAGETMTGEVQAGGVREQWTARYRGSLAR